MVNCIGSSVKGLSVLLHALFCGRWLHILPLPGGGYRVPTSAFVFHAVAGVRAKAVLEFLLFEILRLFRIEFGRDGRGLGARRITGSVSADAPARTATPPMSAMSVMFFIYIYLYFSVLTRLQFQTKRRSHMGPKSNSSSHWRREARRGERRPDDSPSPKRSFPREKIGLPRNKRPIPTLNSCRS